MKKTYINPVVQVVTIQTAHMMALSYSDRNASTNEGKVDLESKDEGDWDLWEDE